MSDIVLSAGVRQNLLSLQSTADLMSTTQNRLATGKKVNSALDNPNSYFTSQSLQFRAGDLNDLLDSIGQAQKTLEAANQGITSLTKLVQSARSIVTQARQSAGPTTSYTAIGKGSTAQAESNGTFTGSGGTFAVVAAGAGTVNFSVTVNGTANNLSFVTTIGQTAAQVAASMQAAIDGNSNTVGHVTVTAPGQIKIDNQDVNTDVSITASTVTASLGLTTNAVTNTAVNSTNLLDNIIAAGGAAGATLTAAVNGGTNQVITFGYSSGQVHDLAGLNTALAGFTGVTASATGTGNRTLAFSVAASTGTANSLVLTGTSTGTATAVDTALSGSTTGLSGTYNGVGTVTNDSTRASLQSDYNNILTQIDALAGDSSYNGINLINGDNLKVIFNEKNTSSLTITGAILTSTGLGLQAIGGSQFQSNTNIDTALSALDGALTALRTQASRFGANVTVIQTRQDFTKNLINTLQTGSDSLVLADTNEEGANMLALQTRQSLSTTALSLANQASQAVLRLFG
jgi:flagellin-like hook-associated protein FlgL